MATISRETSALLVIDFQSRLMPAIDGGMSVIANARRLLMRRRSFKSRSYSPSKTWTASAARCRSFDPTPSHRAQDDVRCLPHGRLFQAVPDRPDFIVIRVRNPCLRAADRNGPAECGPTGSTRARRSRLSPCRKQGDRTSANGAEWSGGRDHGDGDIRVA